MHVLTCFRPEDLDQTRLTHGAVDLYTLLDREISGNTDLGTPASRAAASEQALGADALVADLGDRLRARGARVWHQYDGAIDVVAAADPLNSMGHDDPDLPRPVAIESDGTTQYRTMSVRERSRLRPQLLERLGWRYLPLWTIEVFTDPSSCADRIAGYLGLEKLVLPDRTTSSTGFLDDDFNHAFHGIDGTPSAGVSYLPSVAGGNRNSDGGNRNSDGGNRNSDGGNRRQEDGSQGRRAQDAQEAGAVTTEDRPGEDRAGEDMRQTKNDDQNENNHQDNKGTEVGPDSAVAADAAPSPAARATAGGAEEILPSKAAEDDARSWGDREDDHDTWLKEQKPPHWG
jgi:hypothetical protein